MGKISVELYGESHSAKIGVRIKGVAAGTYVDEEEISALLERRRAVKAAYSTPRLEKDGYEFVSGVENGSVTGDIVAEIPNLNTRSSDYPRYIPRPSHADYVSFVKDGLREITPGGGRFSGRMTAPLCIAGGIFKGILKTKGIRIDAFVKSIGGIVGKGYFDGATEEEMVLASKTPPYAITNGEQMLLAGRQRGMRHNGNACRRRRLLYRGDRERRLCRGLRSARGKRDRIRTRLRIRLRVRK